ncbi:unnamed protein product [Symbiodinium sp. KB8]|nr:unnamed protein product [Symbiodinium sp. KB8]
MQIDETTLRRQDTQVLEIPASEVVSELHGKALFPIHKEIEEIAPNSFTKTMIEQNFDAASGDVLQREPMTQAFVKPNEALNKIKPRLIQHKGPTGSASAALMNKSVEHMIFRLAYFVARSIKGTDHKGVNERILKFYNDFKAGGFASTDFGSFDSSITDKAVEDPKKPGLRRIIEEAVMNAIEKKFPESSDLKNTSQKRWKKSDKVKFDTLTLYTSILIRYSGDGLTSVGNYLINWTIDQVVDTIAEVCFTAWDWKDTTINEFFQAFPSFVENEETINYIVIKVKEAAEYMAETIRRESSGQHVKRPNREFIAGEGDDRAKAYLWDFIQKFELKDRKNKRSREVLGLENRIEFTSRIYVPLSGGTQMRSFPKLRKTFSVASITFNVRDHLHLAAATKMISIMMVAEQCPLQFAYYSMVARVHLHMLEDDRLDLQRRKYEWWESKLVHLISDNSLDNSLRNVYEFLRGRVAADEDPALSAQMVSAISKEMQTDSKSILAMIDAFEGVEGGDLQLDQEGPGRAYRATRHQTVSNYLEEEPRPSDVEGWSPIPSRVVFACSLSFTTPYLWVDFAATLDNIDDQYVGFGDFDHLDHLCLDVAEYTVGSLISFFG